MTIKKLQAKTNSSVKIFTVNLHENAGFFV